MTESKSMLNKLVSYKGIIHERTEDAPFMGALIIAEKCSNNCQGCFNQHLKDGKVFTDENEVVIDPYAGSGSTLLACKQTNRRGYGFEIKKEFVKQFNEQLINNVQIEMSLF